MNHAALHDGRAARHYATVLRHSSDIAGFAAESVSRRESDEAATVMFDQLEAWAGALKPLSK